VAVIASKTTGRMGLGWGSPPPHNKNSNSNYIINYIILNIYFILSPDSSPVVTTGGRSGEEAIPLPRIKILILSPPLVVITC